MLHVERDIRHVQEIVGEVFLDEVSLIAAADHEIMDPMGRIHFHDMPQDRLATDLDHGLRPEMGFFGNSGSETSS